MKKLNSYLDLSKEFMEEAMMGPNSMQLLANIRDLFDLKPGMRVLDLGCGKGLTSIYLATTFDVTVYATDLWISATENFNRFDALGLGDRIIPLHADANDLPFADGFFDAVISVDSYHYFGANENYLPQHFAKLVKKGAPMIIVCPGTTEIVSSVPAHLKNIWEDDEEAFATFKPDFWWKELWEKSRLVTVTHAGIVPHAREIWWEWASIARKRLGFNDDTMLSADTESLLTIMYLIAYKN